MTTKTILLAAAALVAVSTSAAARDGNAYIGLEGGLIKPQAVKFDYRLRTLLAQEGIVVEHRTGWDADIAAGYDVGFIRVEGEIGLKNAGVRDVAVSPSVFVTSARPVITGRTKVASAMANLLLDFGSDEGLQVYAGGGLGGARFDVDRRITGPGVPVNAGIDGSDRATAWQLLAGLRLPVDSNLDLGLKYRFFNSASSSAIPTTMRGWRGSMDGSARIRSLPA